MHLSKYNQLCNENMNDLKHLSEMTANCRRINVEDKGTIIIDRESTSSGSKSILADQNSQNFPEYLCYS